MGEQDEEGPERASGFSHSLTGIPRIFLFPHTFFKLGHRTTSTSDRPLFAERLLPGLAFQNPFLVFSSVIFHTHSPLQITRQIPSFHRRLLRSGIHEE
jgi:hypothetical protein